MTCPACRICTRPSSSRSGWSVRCLLLEEKAAHSEADEVERSWVPPAAPILHRTSNDTSSVAAYRRATSPYTGEASPEGEGCISYEAGFSPRALWDGLPPASKNRRQPIWLPPVFRACGHFFGTSHSGISSSLMTASTCSNVASSSGVNRSWMRAITVSM